MKSTFKTMILGFGLLTFINCQQVNPVTTGPFTPTEPTGNDLSCPGTNNLNCFVDFPDNSSTFDQFDFTQSYVACMDACLPASCTDSGGDIIDEASAECPAQFQSCDAQCSMTSNESPISNLPGSDGLNLPDNPKAVLVEITGCFTTGTMNEVHFKGHEINVLTPVEVTRLVMTSGGFLGIGGTKRVHIGYGIGRNFDCPTNLKNRVRVVSKPNASDSVTIGSNTITVVPFANTAVVTKERAIPHSLTFSAISSAMKEEMDLSTVVVIPKSFAVPSPSIAQSLNDWRYYNNSDLGYGTTVMFGSYFFVAPFTGATGAVTQTMSAYIFANAAE
ncbi:MAG: hypothetical protein IT286_04300 [Proteobacteria bacterium]|nr:hypothetical protein [Pseudomonadota bacterium]